MRYSILLASLVLSACAPSPLGTLAGSAAGSQPGYYPGLAMSVSQYQKTEWLAWFQQNKPAIVDIEQKTAAIKNGTEHGGCIGQNLHTCVATLAQTLAVADEWKTSTLFFKTKVDINDKPIPAKMVLLEGFIPGIKDLFQGRIQIDIRLDSSGTVKSVRASLPKDPFFSKTQEEYDQTGAYEVIAAMSRKQCPDLAPKKVAQFLHNAVQPKAHFTGEEWDFTSGITRGNSKHAKADFCGNRIDFNSTYGRATDLVTLDNLHGAFGGMMLTFK